ncbi:MAG: pyrroline-5-carboxylate reductase [Muribaculaceae bacterium]|nr:pyrroline-5-carboxylate reductase [Muribaculaceae bacterium]
MTQEHNGNRPVIAVIGAGNIGSAMARGLVRTGARISLYNRSSGRLEAFGEHEGVERTTDLTKAVDEASMVVICVEGDAVEPVVKQMGKQLGRRKPVVVSCAAAPSLAQLEAWVKPYISAPKIVRVLPNIAATCGKSVNLVCASGVDESELQMLCRLFDATGKSYVLSESRFAAAMAISSCGIANVLRYVRAAMEAGVELGLSPAVAKELAAGSLEGAAELIFRTGAHPEALIDSVTTPGGLTIRGVNAMETAGFSAAVMAGVKAAAKK